MCQKKKLDYLISLSNSKINLFAEQDKHLSKVNTTTQIVVQVRLMLMKKSYHMKYYMKLVLELLNQSANIGTVKLDDTARKNMTP